MKSIIFSCLLLGAVSAKADIITCYFYEPFYKLVIDTEAETLTKVDQDWFSSQARVKRTTVLSTNVKVEKMESKSISAAVDVPRYQIKSNGEAIMELDLSYSGNDGVYGFVYPYEAKYKKQSAACESDKIKRHNGF
jgi:hypothetical protein